MLFENIFSTHSNNLHRTLASSNHPLFILIQYIKKRPKELKIHTITYIYNNKIDSNKALDDLSAVTYF